jgi:hypothetical protein
MGGPDGLRGGYPVYHIEPAAELLAPEGSGGICSRPEGIKHFFLCCHACLNQVIGTERSTHLLAFF